MKLDRSGADVDGARSATADGGTVGLTKAKAAKKDEFYTQFEDINNELQYYGKHFRGKVVLCNCDDPYESNFFKYFALKFNELGLKKLIATCYSGSPVAQRELALFCSEDGVVDTRTAYKVEISEVGDVTGDGRVDLFDVEELLKNGKNVLSVLKGDGDFRNEECLELLKEADIVATNPPFSLFREYVGTLMKYGRKFLIIGNVNAITYKEIFPRIKANEMWLGASIHSGDRAFYVPEDYPLNAAGCGVDANGRKYIRVKGVRWFTNLDYVSRHEPMMLMTMAENRRFSRHKDLEAKGAYQKYDNYDAIEVPYSDAIPSDYKGVMGVPITFLDKYCPDQFEIIMLANGNARTNTNKEVLQRVKYHCHDADKGGLGILNGKRGYARILIQAR